MIIFKSQKELKAHLENKKSEGLSIGFVPTMGALHAGHLYLVQSAKKAQQYCVCSIFVNPAQFNDPKDFEKYPQTTSADINLLESASCDVLYLPSVNDIYPEGAQNAKTYTFGYLETVFEGAKRPGHFEGVGKVMAILLNIVMPNTLFMGSKDFQQCLVVKQLIQQMQLADQIEFIACPTQREADGLALSSRNKRLNESQRVKAGLLYQCLISIQSKFLCASSFKIVQKECEELLRAKGIEPEYISIAHADSLEPLDEYDKQVEMVALIAAWVGEVRLIDNLIINPKA